MSDTSREHELEALIFDLCDGHLRSWWDIQSQTGLSEERCKEMVIIIDDVFDKYNASNSK